MYATLEVYPTLLTKQVKSNQPISMFACMTTVFLLPEKSQFASYFFVSYTPTVFLLPTPLLGFFRETSTPLSVLRERLELELLKQEEDMVEECRRLEEETRKKELLVSTLHEQLHAVRGDYNASLTPVIVFSTRHATPQFVVLTS